MTSSTSLCLASLLCLASAADNTTTLAQCIAGSPDLCGCSELIKLKVIKSFDDCTQEAAIAYCKKYGACPDMLKLEDSGKAPPSAWDQCMDKYCDCLTDSNKKEDCQLCCFDWA